jgi:hypothetical protein
MTLLQWGQTFIPLQHCSHVTLCPQFVNNIHRSFVLQITHNRFFFNSLLITLRLAGSKTKGSNLAMNYFQESCNMYWHTYRYTSGRRDRMVGGFTTTYAISAYHHWSCEFEYRLCEEYSIQHYLIKFVNDLWRPGFLRGTPVSSTNKTDRHHIAEISLKVELNTITLTPDTLTMEVIEVGRNYSKFVRSSCPIFHYHLYLTSSLMRKKTSSPRKRFSPTFQ